jgi:hypothetical protein
MICREHVVGMEVKFIGCSREQVRWGNNTDPKGLLKEGEKYIVKKIEEHSQHTKITLEGVKGKFNTACFM